MRRFEGYWPEGEHIPFTQASFDDGLSAQIRLVMSAAGVDYATARAVVHALHTSGYLK